jgi:hypothetical protein
MANGDINREDAYEDALALVFDAIATNRKGLRANPSKDEKRKLNKQLARLEAERADLEAMLDAIIDGETIDVAPPTQAQVDEIASLTGQVEGWTRDNRTAAGAITVATNVLALAVEITGG